MNKEYKIASEYLYAIYCKLSNNVKIGITNNIDSRLQTIQACSPTQLEVIALVRMYDAYTVEQRLHKYLKSEHVHGEWFILENKAADIINLMKAKDINALRSKVYTARELRLRLFPKPCKKRTSYTALKAYKDSIESKNA